MRDSVILCVQKFPYVGLTIGNSSSYSLWLEFDIIHFFEG
jgi:hypothetical protein